MTNPPIVRTLRLVLTFLAVLHPVGADPVLPGLSQVVITPASAGTPPSFTGMVTGGPPNGTARLQASVDLGVADPWTNVATTFLDNLGSATFTSIPDPRPQAANAKWSFFRVATNVVLLGQMVFIPGGTFQMGNSLSPSFGNSDELPVHSVYVSGFYMQNTEVTKAQWDAVANWAAANGYNINTAGGSGKATNHPVYDVSWYEVVKYCNARSQMENLTPCYTVGGGDLQDGQQRCGDL
jgi:formylglycine-generating enzyme required for sulfatase activity